MTDTPNPYGDQLFERRRDEGPKAFTAFRVYRDMGQDRTISAVARRLKRSRTLLQKWATHYEWNRRVAAYEDYLDLQRRQATVTEVGDMASRHANIAVMIQQRVVERLTRMTQAEVDEMSFDQLATLMRTAESIERRARGEPDTLIKSEGKTAVTGPGGGPVVVVAQIIETVVTTRAEIDFVRTNPSGELLDG